MKSFRTETRQKTKTLMDIVCEGSQKIDILNHQISRPENAPKLQVTGHLSTKAFSAR